MAGLFKVMFLASQQCSHRFVIRKQIRLFVTGQYSAQCLIGKGTSSVLYQLYTGIHTLNSQKRTECVLPPHSSSYYQYIQKRCKHEIEYPPLIESDLEETFIRGSGPGGQKINKTSNCVMLKHLPTGIVVKCQESRSLDTNRVRARRHMQERLDSYYNGEESVLAQEKQEMIRKKIKRKNVTNKKLEKLKQFKEREGLS
ncbi:hypothetical protein LSH36_222g04038 [Paralvinella palmiformis]|uniref:Prokaryotic-type class I peptide chain release factors domain-containing protein n=1 Tax=Paralvinella palmiformis TaxID=53620 RepID=A0AAD9JQ55_9ANNE|nr:hypothetical protein LSH36_222g04038 [Paralvinella palmiformis]